MNQPVSAVRTQTEEARQRRQEASEELQAAAESRPAEGWFAHLRKKAGGAQRTVARQAMRLQASRGNQYVQERMHVRPQPAASWPQSSGYAGAGWSHGLQRSMENSMEGPTVAHEAPAAAIQRDGGTTTVTLTLTESLGGTYDVTGASLEAAGNEMSARGEWGLGGARNIAYSSGTVGEDGIVSSVTITGVLFRTLPNWTQLSSKPEAVRNEWNRMLGALSGHESHHVSIARTHLNALPAALSAIHEDDLATVWSEKMTALQNAQNEYDTTTTNGQTEGVTLDLNVEQPPESEGEEGEAEFGGIGGEE